MKDPSVAQVDLGCDDVLFNCVTVVSQLKRTNDGRPWRGPKEKSEVLIKLFVHGLTSEDGIVANLTPSTGTTIPKFSESFATQFYFSLLMYYMICRCLYSRS